MLRALGFTLIGIFLALIVAGGLAAFGWLKLGSTSTTPLPVVTSPTKTISGFIRNATVDNNQVDLMITPIGESDQFRQNCQLATNLTDWMCPVSRNVELTTRPLTKNINYRNQSTIINSLQTIYNSTLFEFEFSAGEISQITEK